MSDKLTDLLRDRFAGHEADVPPGAWEQVSGKLAASASGEGLRETLQEKFRGHEAEVSPSAWANISGQLGVAGGASVPYGWIAAGVGAVVLSASLLLWNNTDTTHPDPVPEKPTATVAQVPVRDAAPKVEPTPQEAVPAAAEVHPAHAPRSKAAAPASAEKPQAEVQAKIPASRPEASYTPEPEQPLSPVIDPEADRPEIPEQEQSTPTAALQTPPAAQKHTDAGEPAPSTSAAPQPEASADASTDNTEDEQDPFGSAYENTILIPNVFSPQGDGVNDKLRIVARGYEKADVRIFAAKGGALIFRSHDLSNMWDGRLPNGNIAEEGYYRCIVFLTDKKGETHVKSEVVRLFR